MGKRRHRTEFRARTVKQSGMSMTETGRWTGPIRGIVLFVYADGDQPPPPPPVPPLLLTEPDWIDPDRVADSQPPKADPPPGRYCSVIGYAGEWLRGSFHYFDWVLCEGSGGVHDGEIVIPKASYQTASGATDVTTWLSGELKKPNGLFGLTGDHVVLDFLDDNPNFPFIAGKITHPFEDKGAAPIEGEPGLAPTEPVRPRHSLRPRASEGSFRRWKHNGSVLEISARGNINLDTSFAHNGILDLTGQEPGTPYEISQGKKTLPLAAGFGDINLILRYGQGIFAEWLSDPARQSTDPALVKTRLTLDEQRASLAFGQGEVAEIDIQGGGVKPSLQLHLDTTPTASLKGLAIADFLQNLLTTWKSQIETWANTHTHTAPSGGGPTTGVAPTLSLSSWDPTIKTDQILVDPST